MSNVINEKVYSLIDKYDVKASYFTAYPPSGSWDETFQSDDLINVLTNIGEVKETLRAYQRLRSQGMY